MSPTLLFDFVVDKENNAILVKREFAANLTLVWDAWTKAELLDQWWAPKPYQTQTKSLDFKEGGIWLYAMAGPEGDKHWCRFDYEKIQPGQSYSGFDAFCDENGTPGHEIASTRWNNVFTAMGEHTLVSITTSYDSLADLEKIIELGFKEGFTMALGNLDEVLKKL